jgi:hypothetical protein
MLSSRLNPVSPIRRTSTAFGDHNDCCVESGFVGDNGDFDLFSGFRPKILYLR